jgi:uncharacterized protein (DUF1786 family)
MDEAANSIMALDIGSGTQDVLLWRPGEVMENCLQMVLPSPTASLARRVRQATSQGLALHLRGHLMGGGPVAWAIRDHAAAGLPVSAEPQAALTLHDDPAHVQEMGVMIQDAPMVGALEITMGDIQREALEAILERFDLAAPELWCVAVQDHGHQPHGSNRAFRFAHWRSFLEDPGALIHALYQEPPNYLTRMGAVLSQLPKGRVMDTGMAAVIGAGCDPWVHSRLGEGVVVVNLGNQHTLAALVTGDRVWGLFEHHTGALNPPTLARWVQRFRQGDLAHEEVLSDGGHGCAYHPDGLRCLRFEAVAVTGPQRAMADGLGWNLAAPFGNMMLTGCYGLIRAFHLCQGIPWP